MSTYSINPNILSTQLFSPFAILGLSVIALNLAMYLGAPAIVIVGIRKKF